MGRAHVASHATSTRQQCRQWQAPTPTPQQRSSTRTSNRQTSKTRRAGKAKPSGGNTHPRRPAQERLTREHGGSHSPALGSEGQHHTPHQPPQPTRSQAFPTTLRQHAKPSNQQRRQRQLTHNNPATREGEATAASQSTTPQAAPKKPPPQPPSDWETSWPSSDPPEGGEGDAIAP